MSKKHDPLAKFLHDPVERTKYRAALSAIPEDAERLNAALIEQFRDVLDLHTRRFRIHTALTNVLVARMAEQIDRSGAPVDLLLGQTIKEITEGVRRVLKEMRPKGNA